MELSNVVNNLSEGTHRIICKFGDDDKNCETCGIKYNYCDCFLEYIHFDLIDDLIEYKCLCCNKNYLHKFDENLRELFFNTYKFSNNDNNKFILFQQKGVYPYEYMNDWQKFNETSLSGKEDFYRHLIMEYITDANHAHAKRVCKNFEIKKYTLIS